MEIWFITLVILMTLQLTLHSKGMNSMNNVNTSRFDNCFADIKEAALEFPDTFGLSSYPGEVVRISDDSSYLNDNNMPILYLERLLDGVWTDFIKGTPSQIKRYMVKIMTENKN